MFVSNREIYSYIIYYFNLNILNFQNTKVIISLMFNSFLLTVHCIVHSFVHVFIVFSIYIAFTLNIHFYFNFFLYKSD